MSKLSFLLAAAGVALAFSFSHSQEAPSPGVAPEPPAAPSSDNAALFPSGDTQTPSQTATGTSGGGRNGPGGGRGGRRNRSGDSRNAAIQQADSAPLEVRVAFRRAKTAAMLRDPGLADLLVQAGGARTDENKRAYLRTYYIRLYALVRKVDPSPAMRDYVKLLSQVSEQRYDPKRRAVNGDDDDLVGGGGRGGRHRR
jgi:hypothetical protein